MSIDLPEPIARYIAAENRGDTTVLDNCFAEDALVRDEGETIRGLAAIKGWKTETTSRYRHTVEPLGIRQADGTSIVTCRLTGDFPGSPIELRYTFLLGRGRITSLTIDMSSDSNRAITEPIGLLMSDVENLQRTAEARAVRDAVGQVGRVISRRQEEELRDLGLK